MNVNTLKFRYLSRIICLFFGPCCGPICSLCFSLHLFHVVISTDKILFNAIYVFLTRKSFFDKKPGVAMCIFPIYIHCNCKCDILIVILHLILALISWNNYIQDNRFFERYYCCAFHTSATFLHNQSVYTFKNFSYSYNNPPLIFS